MVDDPSHQNYMIDDLVSPDSFAQWLETRNEPNGLKDEARAAINAFREFLSEPNSLSLETLYTAACHSRFLVWEVGLPLLARLAEQSAEARLMVDKMTFEAKAEVRRRSVQYISDRYSKSFCIAMLTRLLSDRSAKVRDFAACRVCCLNLREMLPGLEITLRSEPDPAARYGMDFAFHMIRDGYFFDKRPEHQVLWLYYPNLFPAASPWYRDAQERWENGDPIEEIKADTIKAQPEINISRRPWEWPDDM